MDDFNGVYDNALRDYEDSGDNALVLMGLLYDRYCNLCGSPGIYGLTLRPLGGGQWTCAGCEPEALAA